MEEDTPSARGAVARVPKSLMKTVEEGGVIRITCGGLTGRLLCHRFICPGIHQECIEYDGRLISPKSFSVMGDKERLKDWKNALRINGIQLRKYIDSGQLSFYKHKVSCTGRCMARSPINRSAYIPSMSSSSLAAMTPSRMDESPPKVEFVSSINEHTYSHLPDDSERRPKAPTPPRPRETEDTDVKPSPALLQSLLLQPVDGVQVSSAVQMEVAASAVVQDGVSEEVVVDGTLGMGGEEEDEDEDEEMEDDRVEEVDEPSEERKLWLLIRELSLMDQFFCEIKSSLDNLKNDLVGKDVREEDAQRINAVVNAIGIKKKLQERVAAFKSETEKEAEKLDRQVQELQNQVLKCEQRKRALSKKQQKCEELINISTSKKDFRVEPHVDDSSDEDYSSSDSRRSSGPTSAKRQRLMVIPANLIGGRKMGSKNAVLVPKSSVPPANTVAPPPTANVGSASKAGNSGPPIQSSLPGAVTAPPVVTDPVPPVLNPADRLSVDASLPPQNPARSPPVLTNERLDLHGSPSLSQNPPPALYAGSNLQLLSCIASSQMSLTSPGGNSFLLANNIPVVVNQVAVAQQTPILPKVSLAPASVAEKKTDANTVPTVHALTNGGNPRVQSAAAELAKQKAAASDASMPKAAAAKPSKSLPEETSGAKLVARSSLDVAQSGEAKPPSKSESTFPKEAASGADAGSGQEGVGSGKAPKPVKESGEAPASKATSKNAACVQTGRPKKGTDATAALGKKVPDIPKKGGTEAAAPALTKVVESPGGVLKKVVELPSSSVKKVVESSANAMKKVVESSASSVKKVVESPASSVKKVMESSASSVKKVMESSASSVKKVVESSANAMKKVVESPSSSVKKVVESPVGVVKKGRDTSPALKKSSDGAGASLKNSEAIVNPEPSASEGKKNVDCSATPKKSDSSSVPQKKSSETPAGSLRKSTEQSATPLPKKSNENAAAAAAASSKKSNDGTAALSKKSGENVASPSKKTGDVTAASSRKSNESTGASLRKSSDGAAHLTKKSAETNTSAAKKTRDGSASNSQRKPADSASGGSRKTDGAKKGGVDVSQNAAGKRTDQAKQNSMQDGNRSAPKDKSPTKSPPVRGGRGKTEAAKSSIPESKTSPSSGTRRSSRRTSQPNKYNDYEPH